MFIFCLLVLVFVTSNTCKQRVVNLWLFLWLSFSKMNISNSSKELQNYQKNIVDNLQVCGLVNSIFPFFFDEKVLHLHFVSLVFFWWSTSKVKLEYFNYDIQVPKKLEMWKWHYLENCFRYWNNIGIKLWSINSTNTVCVSDWLTHSFVCFYGWNIWLSSFTSTISRCIKLIYS